jgi:hypothetical protein
MAIFSSNLVDMELVTRSVPPEPLHYPPRRHRINHPPDLDANASLWQSLEHTFTGDVNDALAALRSQLDKWHCDSLLDVRLGSSFLLDWAAEAYTRPGRTAPPPSLSNSITPEWTRKRDLARRQVLASRGRLTSPSSSTTRKEGDVVAVLHLLSEEAHKQHLTNISAFNSLSSSPNKAFAHAQPLPDRDVDVKWVERLNVLACQKASVTVPPGLCHHCHQALNAGANAVLGGNAPVCVKCSARYCRSCLRKTYDQTLAQMANPGWVCPKCLNACWCTQCQMLNRVSKLRTSFAIKWPSSPAMDAFERGLGGGV